MTATLYCVVLVLLAFGADALLTTGAWRATTASSSCRSARLSANKLDGLTIEGELLPVANNLLVKVKEALASTQGGLFIPDNAKERPTEGLVINNGPGRYHPETGVLLEIAVKTGSNVIYGKYDGSELKYNDQPHQLIKDDDVLLVYPTADKEATFANVQCVKDQVLIKLPPREEKNAVGIIISTPGEKDKKRADYGVVAKVRPYLTPC